MFKHSRWEIHWLIILMIIISVSSTPESDSYYLYYIWLHTPNQFPNITESICFAFSPFLQKIPLAPTLIVLNTRQIESNRTK
ncbi:uncharacterized protein FOBCDRAFT_35121 [Fusarium oxysporum Fo47]|uniref:uncharacterized protein n=1 Tax=Fusarium oxysporum Fo47 TaxID=660027 RepID=UPI002869EB3C|nr:uncharacterized protein FOBCDRAFT_35121 [Fusarium oxysporum Fo47]WJG35330.1 hypothetical protein FOBCDRAFT_35121 [Fusarium oxysporum Fo47]